MSEQAVRIAIEEAEEVLDPIDALIRDANDDPGALFEPEALEQLASLKQEDPATFERTFARIKTETKVRTGELEGAIRRLTRKEVETVQNGSPLQWPDTDSWPQPVDGAALLDEIRGAIKVYVALPDSEATAIALWTAHAHAHDISQISPRLAFTSPEKRCGKTTALSVVQQMVPKPLPASNITASAVFRSIEMARPTLLIDEADTFLRNSDELRGILNSGHNRSQAYVIRTVGDEHTPAQFCTWAPVAIAMIGKLPDTLNDRSIVVPLQRKKPEEGVQPFRLDRVELFEPLRRKLVRWASDNQIALRRWDGAVPNELHDRAADNWRPLFAIADTAGGDWLLAARQAAIALTNSEDESSAGVLLLADLNAIFDEAGENRISTGHILGKLHDMDGRPWPEWRGGKPLTDRQLAKLLDPFKISSTTVCLPSGERKKGYKREDFDDVFSRYLPSLTVTPLQGAENLDFSGSSSVTNGEKVTDRKSLEPAECKGCNGVTDTTPQSWKVTI